MKVQRAKHTPAHLPLGPTVANGSGQHLVFSLWEHIPPLTSLKSIIADKLLLAHKAFVEKLPARCWNPELML